MVSVAGDAELVAQVWGGAVPVCVNLDADEVTTLIAPAPLFVLAPRCGYLAALAHDAGVMAHLSPHANPEAAAGDLWLSEGTLPPGAPPGAPGTVSSAASAAATSDAAASASAAAAAAVAAAAGRGVRHLPRATPVRWHWPTGVLFDCLRVAQRRALRPTRSADDEDADDEKDRPAAGEKNAGDSADDEADAAAAAAARDDDDDDDDDDLGAGADDLFAELDVGPWPLEAHFLRFPTDAVMRLVGAAADSAPSNSSSSSDSGSGSSSSGGSGSAADASGAASGGNQSGTGGDDRKKEDTGSSSSASSAAASSSAAAAGAPASTSASGETGAGTGTPPTAPSAPPAQTVRRHFMNSLKEANYIKHGDAHAVNSLSVAETDELWEAVCTLDSGKFRTLSRGKLAVRRGQLRRVPLRVFVDGDTARCIQEPVLPYDANGDARTLGAVLEEIIQTHRINTGTRHRYAAVSHGVTTPLDTPIDWLVENFSYPDQFVYIVLITGA